METEAIIKSLGYTKVVATWGVETSHNFATLNNFLELTENFQIIYSDICTLIAFK